MNRSFSGRTQSFPINGSVPDHIRKVDGTKITGFIREEGLFPARIGALDLSHLRGGVILIDTIDEDNSRISVLPGIIDYLLINFTGVERTNNLMGPWIPKSILFISFYGLHEFIGGSH